MIFKRNLDSMWHDSATVFGKGSFFLSMLLFISSINLYILDPIRNRLVCCSSTAFCAGLLVFSRINNVHSFHHITLLILRRLVLKR